MAVDISRFRQVFLDESRENLQAMEQGLLKLEQGGGATAEDINTIFRAAHSIKGGAGTFGFAEIGEVTHLLETLLDQMRSAKREVTSGAVTVLLQSVDVVRGMLDAGEKERANDAQAVAALTEALQHILGSAPAAAAARPVEAPAKPATQGWRIRFAPHAHLLRSGNEPGRIFRELARMGSLKVEADLARLPALPQCEPESVYLSWTLSLEGAATREQVADVFAWVEGDCDLAIEPIAPAAAEPKPAEARTAAPVPAAAETAEAVVDKPAADKPAEKGGKAADKATAERAAESSSIRVSVEKVDSLINLVGELVITEAMLKQISGLLDGAELDPALAEKLLNGIAQLDRNTRDLQDAVMSVRMLPMDFAFSRFPRVVRDLAAKLGKKVRLRTEGEQTELDKGVIEKIVDPLNHLVRNSLDHGLETPEDRRKAGKDETGTITLRAAHQGGNVVIEVADDGRGLSRDKILATAEKRGLPVREDMTDEEVWQFIFMPGFSTADKVTDVSGRGVGMDVVKRNIVELGGQVDIESEVGEGTTITIRLPLTLAILDGMSVRVGDEIFIIPLNFVVESLQPAVKDVKTVTGRGRVVKVRDEYLTLVPMHELYGVGAEVPRPQEAIVVILEAEGRKLAVLVDELVGQQQVVIKSLDSNYRRVHGVSGATILGDGRVALIVDAGALTRTMSKAA
ncbi:MAG: chemotaxis protein CheA [Gammaproteobacteria bacterium]|nr:chemotaxis protein CheA [Gammaproteobacteria bacterium]